MKLRLHWSVSVYREGDEVPWRRAEGREDGDVIESLERSCDEMTERAIWALSKAFPKVAG